MQVKLLRHYWSEETCTPIMVKEFEILGGFPAEIRAAVLDSLLTEFDKYQIPYYDAAALEIIKKHSK